jgi:hypothetical protein
MAMQVLERAATPAEAPAETKLICPGCGIDFTCIVAKWWGAPPSDWRCSRCRLDAADAEFERVTSVAA